MEIIDVNRPRRTAFVLRNIFLFHDGSSFEKQSICHSVFVLVRSQYWHLKMCSHSYSCFIPCLTLNYSGHKKETQKEKKKKTTKKKNDRRLIKWAAMQKHFQEHHSFGTHWPQSIMHWFMWCYQQAAVSMGLLQTEGYRNKKKKKKGWIIWALSQVWSDEEEKQDK